MVLYACDCFLYGYKHLFQILEFGGEDSWTGSGSGSGNDKVWSTFTAWFTGSFEELMNF